MIDWTPVIEQCAPQVAVSTMRAVIHTESGFNPLAINVNGGGRLTRQPRSAEEAAGWAQWLINRGYSVDLGLMQINSANLARLNLNSVTAFDPCRNLHAGATILAENYGRAIWYHKNPNVAVLKALSAYNTGNFQRGFSNGYVGRVIKASANLPLIEPRVPPLTVNKAARGKTLVKMHAHSATGTRNEMSPHSAMTKVTGFDASSIQRGWSWSGTGF